MRNLLVLLLLAFSAAACVGDHSETVDVAATYDAFGADISPLDAVPVQTVASDGAALIGKPVKLEGRITEVCQGMGCWLSFQVVDGPLVRIDVPRDEDGEYVYTFPKDASGRRAIVSGILTAGLADHHAEGDTDGMDHHAEGDMDGMDHDEEGDMDGMDHHAEGDMDGMDHHAEGDMDGMDHDEEAAEGHDDAETRVLNQSVYTLTATGALIERVRA